MVTKSKDHKANEQKKRRSNVGKLQLNKETIQDLTASQQKQLKGGQKPPVNDTERWTCSCAGCG